MKIINLFSQGIRLIKRIRKKHIHACFMFLFLFTISAVTTSSFKNGSKTTHTSIAVRDNTSDKKTLSENAFLKNKILYAQNQSRPANVIKQEKVIVLAANTITTPNLQNLAKRDIQSSNPYLPKPVIVAYSPPNLPKPVIVAYSPPKPGLPLLLKLKTPEAAATSTMSQPGSVVSVPAQQPPQVVPGAVPPIGAAPPPCINFKNPSRCTQRLLFLDVHKGMVYNVGPNVTTVFIADPAIADFHIKAPGVIYVYAKKVGETSLYGLDSAGNILFNNIIKITYNLRELRNIIALVIPCGNNIEVLSAADSLLLRGHVDNPAQAETIRQIAERYVGDSSKVLNFLRIDKPTQVNLRVQVIEISRELSRALGIDWNAAFQTNRTDIGIHPRLIPPDFAPSGSVPPNAINFLASLQPGHFNLAALIQVLDLNGLITILSEPNLTALSGDTASFLVGGEFPIPVPQGNTGAVTIIFKKFGVSLSFSPTILEDRKINLQVRPEVSQLSEEGAVVINGFRVPSLATRRAQTTVELHSGQSFAIAGLLQNNATRTLTQLPGLCNLPILGKLFMSEKYRRNETELVIVVTPYIVRPAGNDSFCLPTEALGKWRRAAEKSCPCGIVGSCCKYADSSNA